MPEDSYLKLMYVTSIVFLIMWTGTEVYEAFERYTKWQVVTDFIGKGDRFTSNDGKALESRICRLETLHGIECK